MAYLSSIELDEGRGQRVGVFLKSNGAHTIMAYVWMDRDRRYFISTASLLQDGKDYSRIRWRQPDLPEEDFGGVNNEEAEQQELTVSQPKCSEIYYNTCAAIDQHNRHQPCIHAVHPKYGGSYVVVPRFCLHFLFDLESILLMTIMLVNCCTSVVVYLRIFRLRHSKLLSFCFFIVNPTKLFFW